MGRPATNVAATSTSRRCAPTSPESSYGASGSWSSEHHVATGTGPERGLSVGAGGQRLGSGERLLGVPRRPRVGGAVDRRGHRQPRVERRDRGVGAEHQLDAGGQHRPEREAAVGALGPAPLGDVAVVEQVGRLDAGADPELGHPGQVGEVDELGVLDPAAGAGRRERVQPDAERRVADRVQRDPEAVAVRGGEELDQLLGGVVEPALGVLQQVAVGVLRAAVRRPGVQRAVRDDLERAHLQQPVGVGEVVAGPQPGGDHLGQPLGVRRGADAQAVDALGEALRPVEVRAAELQVGDADDAAGGRVADHLAQRQLVGQAGAGQVAEAAEHREPVVLVERGLPRGYAEQGQRRGVQPAVVGVAADQHDRVLAADRVELGHRGQPGPGAGAVPVAGHHALVARVEGVDVAGHPGHHLLRCVSPGHVEPRGDVGPLGHVHVVVPEARRGPATGGVEDLVVELGREPLGDVGDDAVDDAQVQRLVGRGGDTRDRDQAGIADQGLNGRHHASIRDRPRRWVGGMPSRFTGDRSLAQRAMQHPLLAPVYERAWRPFFGWAFMGFDLDHLRHERSLTVAALRLRPGDVVLDVACGPGNFTAAFAAAVAPTGLAIGVDLSAPMLARARATNALPGRRTSGATRPGCRSRTARWTR